MKLLCLLLLISTFYACLSKESSTKISNTGIAIVHNGRDRLDTLKYTCDSCYEKLRDKKVFDTIISISTSEAKDCLKNKLSFIPLTADINVINVDSMYYTNGNHIDSLVVVLVKYKCIGKNGYGVESEVESSSLIYLVNFKVVSLDGRIRKEPLSLYGKSVSRSLDLYSGGDILTIVPTQIGSVTHLIVSAGDNCVGDARLRLVFEDGDEVVLNSWNDFNCKGKSYFQINRKDVDKLGEKKLSYISFSEDETIIVDLPENEKDYFMQYKGLIEAK